MLAPGEAKRNPGGQSDNTHPCAGSISPGGVAVAPLRIEIGGRA